MKDLITERLCIQKLTTNDLENAQELLTDDFDYYYGPFRETTTVKDRLNWIVSLSNWGWAGDLYGDRAIVLKTEKTIIGLCGIDPWVWNTKTKKHLTPLFEQDSTDLATTSIEFELGYALKASYRNKGYATEASSALIKYAFEKIKVRRILARTDIENTESRKMMKRLGMKTYLSEEWGGVGAILYNSEI